MCWKEALGLGDGGKGRYAPMERDSVPVAVANGGQSATDYFRPPEVFCSNQQALSIPINGYAKGRYVKVASGIPSIISQVDLWNLQSVSKDRRDYGWKNIAFI